MSKQQEIEQLRAFAKNCEIDMHRAISNMNQSDKLASDIRRLIDGEVYVVEVGAALQPQADTSVLQAAPWPPAGETLTEPEAMRYDFDGYGWKYIDNGSGSDWMTRHPEGEFLFTKPQALQPQAADDKIKALAAKAPKDVRIYPGGGEVIPQAASDCRTCQHLSEAWGVCEARPKCVGGEQYVYFPEKQLWDKTPRNDGQAAHQEMREALYAEFNRAVGRQHD